MPALIHVPPGLTVRHSKFCSQNAFMCLVWVWEQTAIMSLYSMNWLVFAVQKECSLRGTNLIFTYKSDYPAFTLPSVLLLHTHLHFFFPHSSLLRFLINLTLIYLFIYLFVAMFHFISRPLILLLRHNFTVTKSFRRLVSEGYLDKHFLFILKIIKNV